MAIHVEKSLFRSWSKLLAKHICYTVEFGSRDAPRSSLRAELLNHSAEPCQTRPKSGGSYAAAGTSTVLTQAESFPVSSAEESRDASGLGPQELRPMGVACLKNLITCGPSINIFKSCST